MVCGDLAGCRMMPLAGLCRYGDLVWPRRDDLGADAAGN